MAFISSFRVGRDTVYPDALHDSWTATYENPELYEWLLAQRRKTADAPAR